eukprot:gene20267-22253_t
MEKNLQEIGHNIDKLNWKYLAEGNSSVVFACRSSKVVLRCKKSAKHSTGPNEFSSDDEMHYLNNIIRPILQEDKYIITPQLLEISDELYKRLNSIALEDSSRPDEREKSVLDEKTRVAFLLPHLGFLQKETTIDSDQVFAVEIKPKWGALTDKNCKIKLGHEVKLSTCRFCMQQHYKLKLGKIKQISSYCPLDLFSNSLSRIKNALRALFDNPQNNLRVFYNGELAYTGLAVDDEVQSTADFEEFLKNLTFKESESNVVLNSSWMIDIVTEILCHDSRGILHDKFINKNTSEFENQGVLNHLLAAQLVDKTGVEEIYEIYNRIQQNDVLKKRVNELTNLHSDEWMKFEDLKVASKQDVTGSFILVSLSDSIAGKPCGMCQQIEVSRISKKVEKSDDATATKEAKRSKASGLSFLPFCAAQLH